MPLRLRSVFAAMMCISVAPAKADFTLLTGELKCLEPIYCFEVTNMGVEGAQRLGARVDVSRINREPREVVQIVKDARVCRFVHGKTGGDHTMCIEVDEKTLKTLKDGESKGSLGLQMRSPGPN